MTAKPTSDQNTMLSPNARRMRLHRERRRDVLRCLTIEIKEAEIDTLVSNGLLQHEMRNQSNAIIRALYEFFDHTLGSRPWRATQLHGCGVTRNR
jgi:hypothetical protein